MTRPRSLQGRLLVLVIGLVLLVWACTAVLTWFDARHELDELLDSHLAQAAALLVAQQSEEHEEDHEIDAAVLHRYAPKVVFQVFHEGRLQLRSANAPTRPLIDGAAVIENEFRSIQIDGTPWRVFATRGAEDDVQVFVGERMESRAAILWAVLRSTLWPMLLALPLLALSVWWAIAHGLAPLRELGAALARRKPQALQPVAMGDLPSEMAPMLDALNSLFGRIAALLDAERRFTADAAHELRTPIAAIRAQAQVALGESDAAARRHALESTLAGCDRATRLVEQLLTLSRLDADATSTTSNVDLGALVHGVVAQVATKAVAKEQSLELDAEPGCLVAGNDTLLAVLVRNLVDNAVRYSPRGARVAVRVARAQGQIELSVDDSGPGMGAAQLERLGERFFRAPGSDESGSGLGWSIVRRIAAALEARVQATGSKRLGGLEVRVSFTPAPAAAGS